MVAIAGRLAAPENEPIAVVGGYNATLFQFDINDLILTDR